MNKITWKPLCNLLWLLLGATLLPCASRAQTPVTLSPYARLRGVPPASTREGYALPASIASRIVFEASIVGLFLFCSPPAISRLVITVIVGIAVECVFWRLSSSHVCKELLKVMPALTDDYSSSSVECEAGMARILAALKHHGPRVIFRRMWITFSVHDHGLKSGFQAATTAACRTAFQKTSSEYDNIAATFAVAQPSGPTLSGYQTCNCEALKCLSC
jgi:hypothetical protein